MAKKKRKKSTGGVVGTFCGQMAKRTHQYAVRSAYDLFPKKKR